MAYLNDPRENRIGPNGELWESDGRTETRYLWNGAYVDLCNLPPDEYTKTIFHTDGEGGGDKPVVVKDTVFIKTDNKIEKDKCIVFNLVASKMVASDISVVLKIKTANGVIEKVSTILNGSNTSKEPIVVNFAKGELIPMIESMIAAPTEDKKYKYVVIAPEKVPLLYSLSLKNKEIDNLSDEELLKRSRAIVVPMKDKEESTQFSTNIMIGDFVISIFTSAEEKKRLIAEYATDIIFVTDKKVKDIYAGSKVFTDLPQWKKVREFTEASTGIKYYVWLRRDLTGPQTMHKTMGGGVSEDKNWNIIVTY